MANRRSDRIDPGPRETSLLRLQGDHISDKLWQGEQVDTFKSLF